MGENSHLTTSIMAFDTLDIELTAMGEAKFTLQKRLLHMMAMSRTVTLDISGLARFSHVLKVSQRRSNAIRWIKDVTKLAHVSVESRDTSMQIFDRFLGVCIADNKNILGHSNDVALAAAVSVLIASKMHETRPLSMSSFAHLKTDDLIRFERLVITKLGFAIFPLASPVSFIRYLLSLWADGNDYPQLLSTACELAGDFYEAPEAPHFAPSVIALSALLLSFSKLGMDCSDWLEHVPNICLPSPAHPIFNSSFLLSFLDVDNCISVFQRIQSHAEVVLEEKSEKTKSPQTPVPSQVEERLISPNCVWDLFTTDTHPAPQQVGDDVATLKPNEISVSGFKTVHQPTDAAPTNIMKISREDNNCEYAAGSAKRQRCGSA